jgi:sugar/nucleoside kinase (ribokinase family)
MFDVIVVGDSVIDTYIPLLEAHVVNKSPGLVEISLPFGAKVPVGDASSSVAGNAANVAVGLSRLGLKTGVYTMVGNRDDERFDDRIKHKLKEEKVDIRYVVEDDNLPSNHNVILTYKGERTILTHHQPWKYRLPDLDVAKYIYLTSLSESMTESRIFEQLVQYIERTHAKLVYQPGTFEIRLGAKKQARLLSLAEALVLNIEEAKTLLGFDPGKKMDIKTLLRKLHDLGPRKVVITAGKGGSYGFNGDIFYQLGLFPANLVEMTGAGDAYACGLTAALLKGKTLAEGMRWGTANSAGVVEEVGAQKGLLHKTKMEEVLKVQKAIVAEEI